MSDNCNNEKDHECCGGHHNDPNHECGCGHNHDENNHDFITITLEDGKDVECAILGTFDVEDKEYMALLPIESDEVLVFSYEITEEQELILDPILDEDEFNKVSNEFRSLYGEENFEYDEGDEA